MSQEEILDLKFDLLDPNLLDKIADSFNEKIIGETNNKKILFLACMSKDLPQENRISAMISSSSSAGKSNITNRILDAFSDDVIEYTQFTDSFYMRKLGNTSLDGKTANITFTIKREDLEKTLSIIEKNKQKLNYNKITHDDKLAKVSIIGAGMIANPGVTHKMFRSLANEKINILAISTSEIKISVLIREESTQKAISGLIIETRGQLDF